MRRLYFCFFCLVFSSGPVYAQEISHSDVFFTYGATQIEITPQGNRLTIPQVMPDGGFFAQANVNPGFFSERDVGGGTGANDVVGYNVLGDLVFWSEGEFGTPRPTTEIRIVNNPRSVEDTIIGTGTGEQRASFDPLENAIGQSSGSGDFHAHVDFRLEPLTTEPEEKPLFGAYGLKLSLSSDNVNVQDSDPFFIVFRFGIEEDQFTRALDDFDALLSLGDGIVGDFNSDAILSAEDINLLSTAVIAGTNSAAFDLTDDQLVNELDRKEWVEGIVGTLFGDADLDGSVQFADFLALSAGFGMHGGWAEGDFDGNGEVQFADFLTLSANFGQQPMVAEVVPEPANNLLPLLCAVLFYRYAGRCRWQRPDFDTT